MLSFRIETFRASCWKTTLYGFSRVLRKPFHQ
jgi:hypothetical protein